MAQYRIPVEETFSWQRPVINMVEVTAPASPTKGDRYVIAGVGGDWSTATIGDIAWYDGAAWKFDTPLQGWSVYNKADDEVYKFNGAAWAALVGGAGTGDMTKAVYDADDDGIVDEAESLNDGTNTVTAAQAKEAYDRRGAFDADLGCIIMEI
jgi:hypothetical protein